METAGFRLDCCASGAWSQVTAVDCETADGSSMTALASQGLVQAAATAMESARTKWTAAAPWLAGFWAGMPTGCYGRPPGPLTAISTGSRVACWCSVDNSAEA